MKYFDIEELIDMSPMTRLFYIIGARGVGKSYSAKKYVLKQFFKYGKQFIYNRRWTTEITSGELLNTFDDVLNDEAVKEWIQEFTEFKGYKDYYAFHVLPRAGSFYLVGERENGEMKWLDQVGRVSCVTKASKIKGQVLNINFSSILFDEFITDEGYFLGPKEPEQFAKIVNTVGRANNPDLRIFMLGNPDSNIELNPYIAGSNLMLDYAHLQNNAPYFYDRVQNGRVLANNVCFIKLAPTGEAAEKDEYLNAGTLGIWNTSEEEMSVSGEVKTRKFINILSVDDTQIKPLYKIIMETPIVANEEYNKKIYAYYGVYKTGGRKEPCVCVFAHDNKTFAARVKDANTLFSRINELDLRKRRYRDMYRFNLPKDKRFSLLHSLIDGIRVNRYVFADRNETANVYEQIAAQSE